MAEPGDPSEKPPDSAPPAKESSRLKITPEQRRFLGPARSRQDFSGATGESPAPESTTAAQSADEPSPARPPIDSARATRPEGGSAPGRAVRGRARTARVLDFQNIVLLLGALVVLFCVFYVGRRFDYWKYELMTHLRAKGATANEEKFGSISASDLIERAVIDEKLGQWKEAVEQLLAAKQKNLSHPGLLFRAAKLCYDHADFDEADQLFERAIAFREEVAEANYYRGMIASGRLDYSAAERFYEAATSAAPFNADYLYSLGETLRRAHRPKDAISYYQRAAVRSGTEQENICRFKQRMAMIEAGDAAEVAVDLEKKMSAGPLSVDWMATQAALAINAGKIDEAVRLLAQARTTDPSLFQGHFAACAGDKYFGEAAGRFPELAPALKVHH